MATETVDLEKINTEITTLRAEITTLRAENAQLKGDLEAERMKNQVLESEIETPSKEGVFQLDGKSFRFVHKTFIYKGKFYTMEIAMKEEAVLQGLKYTNIVKAI